MQRFYWLLLLGALWVRLFDVDVCCAQHTDSLRSVHSLEEIEVTSEAVGGVHRASVPVQTMEQGDFERLGLVNIADVARRMAGVQVQDYGGIGGLKSVSVRGLGAKHTAVSYDGVAVTDAQSGIVDLGRFALDNVASMALAVGQSCAKRVLIPVNKCGSVVVGVDDVPMAALIREAAERIAEDLKK